MRTTSILVAGLALAAGIVVAQAQSTPGVSPGTTASQGIGQAASKSNANANASDEPKVKANDKAYNAALKNLPDKQFDPWRGVR
jgi:hypothetical protein